MTERKTSILLASADHDWSVLLSDLSDRLPGLGVDNLHSFELLSLALANENYDCAVIDDNLVAFEYDAFLESIQNNAVSCPVVLLTDSGALPLNAGASPVDIIPFKRALESPELLADEVWSLIRERSSRPPEDADKPVGFSTGLHDPLTGLPNRSLFFDRVEQAISLASRENKKIIVLLLDLDRFKEVNDSFGYEAGDSILQQVSQQIRSLMRASDSVARLGDDEFAMLLPTGATLAGAVTAAGKVLNLLKEPTEYQGHRFAIGCSIGIALYPDHGSDARKLLRCAESAMRAAKRDGVGFVIHSAGETEIESTHHLALAHDLSSALERNELVVHYQPKVLMRTGRLIGVEALLRWQHPTQGMIFPDVFIPLAEQTGLIQPLTDWVLNATLEQYQLWTQQGIDLTVAVNLSALTLHKTDFPRTVAALLSKWQTPASRLVLEITESAIISDVARATETVEHLHSMGVHISIDDFGTGYTSLAYIRRLPVSEIKVDKSFVMNMTTNQDDLVIVGTIVELGHNLGLKVVAEGVEDKDTFDLLAELDCNIAQGYYISRPQDVVSLETWMRESPWGPESSVEKVMSAFNSLPNSDGPIRKISKASGD